MNGSLVEAIEAGPGTTIRINTRNETNRFAAFDPRTSILPWASDAGAAWPHGHTPAPPGCTPPRTCKASGMPFAYG
jgi:hypothetical protein